MDCCCPRVALRFKALGGPRYALPWTALRQPSREEMRVILPPRQRTPTHHPYGSEEIFQSPASLLPECVGSNSFPSIQEYCRKAVQRTNFAQRYQKTSSLLRALYGHSRAIYGHSGTSPETVPETRVSPRTSSTALPASSVLIARARRHRA